MSPEDEAEAMVDRVLARGEGGAANLLRAIIRRAAAKLGELAGHQEASALLTSLSKRHLERHVRELSSWGRRR